MLVTAVPGRRCGAHGVVSAGCGRSGSRDGTWPGSLQHELPLAARAADRHRGTVPWEACCRAAVLLCADADAASANLASGALACPSCGAGRLRPWGHGRERVIRLRGDARKRLRPRRGRCGSCKVTQILAPSWMTRRRADAVGVIVAVAVASALHGTGAARAGAELGVPAGTCAAGCAASAPGPAQVRREAVSGLVRIAAAPGRDPLLPEPSGSPLGDALSAVAACARAAIAWRAYTAADWDGAAGPVRPGLRPRARARQLIPARQPGHPDARRQAATLTVSIRRHSC